MDEFLPRHLRAGNQTTYWCGLRISRKMKTMLQFLTWTIAVMVFEIIGPLRASFVNTLTTLKWADEVNVPTISNGIHSLLLPSSLGEATFNRELSAAGQPSNKRTRPTKAITTVAYLVSISGCRQPFARSIYDWGAVLKKSIDLNSFPEHPTSRYASKTFVLVTPETKDTKCVELLQVAGFEPHLVDFPVKVEDIQAVEGAENFKRTIARDGCCGEKELIKLHVYNMTDFDVAIHLDLDTLLIQPLDPIIDAMVFPPDNPTGQTARELLFAPELPASSAAFRYPRLATPTYQASVPLSELDVQAYYTKDYNMLPRRKGAKVGMQGGVIIVRPNPTTLDKLINMVKSGKFYNGRFQGSGWFGFGYGIHLWGAMTIQGLLSYYYTEVAHATSIELNRCRFNQIAENPRRSSFDPRGKYPRGTPINTSIGFKDQDCRDRQSNDCDDVQCQTWPLEESYILHYTYCKDPKKCGDLSWNETYKDHHCKLMFRKWFDVRKLISADQHNTIANGNYYPEYTRGYCRAMGEYIPIPLVKT